jgi:hypothetical protein
MFVLSLSVLLQDLRGGHFDVVSSLRQHGTFCFLVVDFSPCGRKIDNSKDSSYALCRRTKSAGLLNAER